MSIRTAIARWLAPEAFRTVERYHYLRATMEEVCRWCSYDFPVIDAAMSYAKVTERNHFRKLGEPAVAAVPGQGWIWQINDFRAHLRKTYLPPAESGAGVCQGSVADTAQGNPATDAPPPPSPKDK